MKRQKPATGGLAPLIPMSAADFDNLPLTTKQSAIRTLLRAQERQILTLSHLRKLDQTEIVSLKGVIEFLLGRQPLPPTSANPTPSGKKISQ